MGLTALPSLFSTFGTGSVLGLAIVITQYGIIMAGSKMVKNSKRELQLELYRLSYDASQAKDPLSLLKGFEAFELERQATAWSRRAQFAALFIPSHRREDALGDILETAELARETLGPRAARFFFWKEWLGVMISAHLEGMLKLLSILVPGRRGVGS